MKLVAINQTVHLKGTQYAPPPTNHPARAAAYVFELPDEAACALVLGKQARPAYPADASTLLTRTGRRMAPHYPGPSAQKEAEEPPAPTSGSESADVVSDALADGRKAALVMALEIVGLDPDDYGNNEERKAALEEWLREQ